MKRRDLLRAAAGGTLAAAWPGWIRQAFAAEKCDDSAAVALVAAAYRRAQQGGRPLLVFVVPTDRRSIWERGGTFGEFLNHGMAAELAPLALVEVVCATLPALQAVIPEVGASDALMVLVDTDEVPAKVSRAGPEAIKPLEGREHATEDLHANWEAAMHARIQGRIRTVAGLVRQLIAPDAQTLTRRVAQARTILTPEASKRIEGALARGFVPPPADLQAGAALVLASASGAEVRTKTLFLDALAGRVRERLTNTRIPGSKWARSSGCGVDIEGEEDKSAVMGCGMGRVPEESRRFLYFLTDER